jgi:hypothetical protein
MKKTILIGFLVIALASLFYFRKSSSDDQATPTTDMVTESLSQNTDRRADSQDSSAVPEPVNPSGSALDTPSSGLKSSAPSSEKKQEWYKNFETSLSQTVAEQGFTQEVADCILTAAKQNLNQEKPMDFDGLSDSCAAKHQLSEVQRDALRKAFRTSVSSSHSVVDMDKWKSCMLAKYKPGSCIPDLIRENVEAFYVQKSGDAPMKKDAFEQERQNEIENILETALKICPKDLDKLNGVYANECT